MAPPSPDPPQPLLTPPPLQLHVLPSPTTPGPVWGSGVLEDGGGFEPPTEAVPQELLPGFLVTLLVPLAVAALLCLLLGHLMCCRREGV